ncbi:MAG: hypothetical protein M3347_04885, partial [Armatimonadota bacterium]|nr:hypothetical protein [Armatimonadota bacterium]
VWLFRNLIQFFALEYEEQIELVPKMMPFQHIEWGQGQFSTNRPLKVLAYRLQTYAPYTALHGGEAGYEGINPEVCSEMNALIKMVNRHFAWLEQTEVEVWDTSALHQPEWNLVRRMARIVLEMHNWPMQPPEASWQQLSEM